jgi:MoxR-like ATPase
VTDPMRSGSAQFSFVGRGDATALESRLEELRPWGGHIGPWRRRPGDAGVIDAVAHPMHPANYIARPDLVHAVNTALMLSKPLLLTGGPGTGKSQLAERIAWEFNLGPVLRFEAQSLSEAADLFYRFDLVGYLSGVELAKSRAGGPLLLRKRGGAAEPPPEDDRPPTREAFARLGPLGQAILRTDPTADASLFDALYGPAERAELAEARPSVVLIDEIDKASRDFPNDLLNGIERMQFELPDLKRRLTVAPALRPVVIITSNQERELPPPFLRRCTFFHIDDPTAAELTAIVAQRFFAPRPGSGAPPALPPAFSQLLDVFVQFRQRHADDLQYLPGTQELIDWTDALRQRRVPADGELLARLGDLLQSASAVTKHRDDQVLLRRYLQGLKPAAG